MEIQLTSKQRAALRGMAQKIDAIVHVGKDGVSENIIKQMDDALTARELVKGSVQQNSSVSAREASDILAEATGAQPVGVIGRKFTLYRPSDTVKEKIEI